MFTTWDKSLLGVAQCGTDRGLEKILENKFPEQSNVSVPDIVEFVTTSCASMKSFCTLVTAVAKYLEEQDKDGQKYEKGQSVSGSTPNISFTKNLADKEKGPETHDKLFGADPNTNDNGIGFLLN